METPIVVALQAMSLEGKKDEKVVQWLKHYSSAHSILIVGDGDFSFSRVLATAFGSGENLVATSLDSYASLISMYGKAKSNVNKLTRMGATVLHGVDVKNMKRHIDLKSKRFDRIVFNFPHAGFIGKENQVPMITAHQLLVKRFFRNASHLLHPGGEIHVSHKTGQPYDRWEIEDLASEFSLVMFKKVEFRKEDYPGYHQREETATGATKNSLYVTAALSNSASSVKKLKKLGPYPS